MTIALICDVLGEANNGTVIATMNLIEHLKSRGHRVLVVSPDGTKAGIPDYFVAPTMSFGPLIDRAVQKNGVALAKPDKAMLRSVIEQADIVHLEMPFALARCAVKLARELNKPVTSSFHCQAENFTAHIGAMNSALVNHLVYKNFYRAVFSQCNAIHYPTDFIRQLFYQHTRCQVPAYVISNGVSDAFFSPAPKGETREKFTIVCRGRIEVPGQHRACPGRRRPPEGDAAAAGSPEESGLRMPFLPPPGADPGAAQCRSLCPYRPHGDRGHRLHGSHRRRAGGGDL